MPFTRYLELTHYLFAQYYWRFLMSVILLPCRGNIILWDFVQQWKIRKYRVWKHLLFINIFDFNHTNFIFIQLNQTQFNRPWLVNFLFSFLLYNLWLHFTCLISHPILLPEHTFYCLFHLLLFFTYFIKKRRYLPIFEIFALCLFYLTKFNFFIHLWSIQTYLLFLEVKQIRKRLVFLDMRSNKIQIKSMLKYWTLGMCKSFHTKLRFFQFDFKIHSTFISNLLG